MSNEAHTLFCEPSKSENFIGCYDNMLKVYLPEIEYIVVCVCLCTIVVAI